MKVYFTKYCKGDQLKEDKLRRSCSIHGRAEKCMQNFDWKS
jgi:hypothetical protein